MDFKQKPACLTNQAYYHVTGNYERTTRAKHFRDIAVGWLLVVILGILIVMSDTGLPPTHEQLHPFMLATLGLYVLVVLAHCALDALIVAYRSKNVVRNRRTK